MTNWHELCKELEGRKAALTIKPVNWEKPPDDWLKIHIKNSISVITTMLKCRQLYLLLTGVTNILQHHFGVVNMITDKKRV